MKICIVFMILNYQGKYRLVENNQTARHDICHMHHMQRMCKIISPWVKFYILKVLLNSLFRYHFGFW